MIFSFFRTSGKVLKGQSLPVVSLFFTLFGELLLYTTFVMASQKVVGQKREDTVFIPGVSIVIVP